MSTAILLMGLQRGCVLRTSRSKTATVKPCGCCSAHSRAPQNENCWGGHLTQRCRGAGMVMSDGSEIRCRPLVPEKNVPV